jgi:hypothetical protein
MWHTGAAPLNKEAMSRKSKTTTTNEETRELV